ncbi:hypothetical protein FY528_01425 [Hymenobacter lutimineralis]|uniref:Uncharacterized protein n=1 Tax=Hymenobacter lutimineralis TaxID=2606448 RepID=A0A5D6VI70_9BACT|nr:MULTISPECIES: hypothetical protein [Hymenobacter]QIX60160.1 hypothetical protein HER32_02740 [Hymenobacter sp. BT18]TYZ14418.1 hypothetical protein FY528_01425 [Hymenobacter lutimineralis]
MNTPFRLDEHRRRPHPPLTPPPDRYFEQLPTRLMQRVQPASAPAWGWLSALSAPLRTALASVVVLGGFAASFFLSPAPAATSSLAQVPQEELVQYLLATDQRLTLADLAELPAAVAVSNTAYLEATPAEVQRELDALPIDEAYL